MAAYRAAPGQFAFPGGESYAALQARGLRALREIAAENEGRTVAIFTHGGLIRTLLCVWYGLPLSRLQELSVPPNTAITTVVYENGAFSVHEEASVAHLAE